MRKIQELLRLKHEQKLNNREIATSLKISASTVSAYLQRAHHHHLSWPLPAEFQDDERLYELLFPPSTLTHSDSRPEPNWRDLQHELKSHKGVTLLLLWHDYRAQHSDGYGYSQFCAHYREHVKNVDVTMRQHHIYGEKGFVDYAGITVPWTDPLIREIQQAQIFVCVLGASNYTYVEATRSQNLRDWTSSHCRAFEYFGGVPKILVPDNLLSGVTSPHHYDPDVNLTYQDLADHYGVAVVPARVRRPQDKAKVEVGVQGIERWILAPLRHQTFFSVEEINLAIKPLLEKFNQRPFQKMDGSRHSVFLAHEKEKLKSLPAMRYPFAEWKKATVGIDYHVAIEKHYYSVPYRYARKAVTVRVSANTIDCFYQQKRVAYHQRQFKPGHTTCKDHMPQSHQAYLEWTPERLIKWAAKMGGHTQQLIAELLNQRAIPQQAFRACLGILRLAKKYSEQRLENAAERALAIGAIRYKSVESILKNGLDQLPFTEPSSLINTTPPQHENVRGQNYYQ